MWGMAVGALYYPLALLKAHVSTGSLPPTSLLTYGIAFVCVLAGGAAVGSAVGAMRPLLRWGKLGAALIGSIVSLPLVAVAVFYALGWTLGSAPLAWTAIIVATSVCAGSLVGIVLYMTW